MKGKHVLSLTPLFNTLKFISTPPSLVWFFATAPLLFCSEMRKGILLFFLTTESRLTTIKRSAWAAALLAASLAFPWEIASAQPLHGCGGILPFPVCPGPNCRWVCVRETLGKPSPLRPQPQREVWRKVCRQAPGSTSGGGKAEIHKKNVPQAKKNKNPGPNDWPNRVRSNRALCV